MWIVWICVLNELSGMTVHTKFSVRWNYCGEEVGNELSLAMSSWPRLIRSNAKRSIVNRLNDRDHKIPRHRHRHQSHSSDLETEQWIQNRGRHTWGNPS